MPSVDHKPLPARLQSYAGTLEADTTLPQSVRNCPGGRAENARQAPWAPRWAQHELSGFAGAVHEDYSRQRPGTRLFAAQALAVSVALWIGLQPGSAAAMQSVGLKPDPPAKKKQAEPKLRLRYDCCYRVVT